MKSKQTPIDKFISKFTSEPLQNLVTHLVNKFGLKICGIEQSGWDYPGVRLETDYYPELIVIVEDVSKNSKDNRTVGIWIEHNKDSANMYSLIDPTNIELIDEWFNKVIKLDVEGNRLTQEFKTKLRDLYLKERTELYKLVDKFNNKK